MSTIGQHSALARLPAVSAFAGALALCFTGPAGAFDMTATTRLFETGKDGQEPSDWQGLYGGAVMSLKRVGLKLNSFSISTDDLKGRVSPRGALVGYNATYGNLVLGTELDVAFGKASTFSQHGGKSATSAMWRTKAGITRDRFLAFASTGLYGMAESWRDLPLLESSGRQSAGIIVGGGFEMAMKKQMTARLEFLHGQSLWKSGNASFSSFQTLRAAIIVHFDK